MRTLLKNAHILTLINKDVSFGHLVIEDDHIAYIGNDYSSFAPFDKEIDCENNLIMPSFKNCHAHAPMVFLRSGNDSLKLEEWLYDFVFPQEKKLLKNPEDIYYLTKLAFLEYLSSGISASIEMYYGCEYIEKAAKDMGFRVVIGPDFPQGTFDYDYIYHKYVSHQNDDMCRYALTLHSVYVPPIHDIEVMNKLVHDLKAPLYFHNSETTKEVENCKNKHQGLTPTEYYNSLGLLDYGAVCYHNVHLSSHDLEIYKDKNIAFVSCPGSNTKLASGVANLKKALENGINVTLGTDGASSNNSLDMFKEMYLACGLQKIYHSDPLAIDPYEVLLMATKNASKAMGIKDIDTLEVNKKADLIMIDLAKPNMLPIVNIINNLVYSGSKDIVKMTMVNGKILYYNNEYFIDEDVKNIYQKVQEITDRLKSN